MLTTTQAAKKLDCDPAWIRRLILDGRLPAKKLGRDWMIKERDLKKIKYRKAGRPNDARVKMEKGK